MYAIAAMLAAHLIGIAKPPAGDAPPRSINARVNSGETRIVCTVGEAGAFDCDIPSGRSDVRLEAEGFAPLYLWDVEAPTKIPEWTLMRGGSIAGWTNGTSVRIAPVTFGSVSDEVQLRTIVTTPTARGFFQATGVPAGEWLVMAESQGKSPSPALRVTLDDRHESMLRDRLDVRPMAKIDLMIVPPVDGSGHPWQVRLAKRDPIAHALRSVRSGEASPSGAWAAGPIEAGDYVVTIASAGTQFHRRDLVVDAASDLQVIIIDAVPVRGRVRLGKIPVKAQVTLGNWNGEKATALAGDDGDFATLAPGAGDWYADVRLPSGQELHVSSIEIRRRDGEESARADITLPGGRIKGRVVDERGNGVTAGVIITRDGRPLTDIRAEDGDFALAGIEPGPATIEAQAKDAWSGPVNVEITEETRPVTLVIRKLRGVEGWLATPAGIPVAGASIRYRTSSSTFVGEAASSPSGRFELVLAPDDSTVDLAVVAPAFGAKLVRAMVPTAGERIVRRCCEWASSSTES